MLIRLKRSLYNAVWNPWIIVLYYLATGNHTATNPILLLDNRLLSGRPLSRSLILCIVTAV
jgi:hypothetical protein